MITITVPLLSVSLFGSKGRSQYIGIFMSIGNVANFIAGPVSNSMFDHFLSYRPAFFMGSGFAFVAVFLYLLLYRLAKKDEVKVLAESVGSDGEK
jgi:MFS family permease